MGNNFEDSNCLLKKILWKTSYFFGNLAVKTLKSKLEENVCSLGMLRSWRCKKTTLCWFN